MSKTPYKCLSCQWLNDGRRVTCDNCNTERGEKKVVAFTPRASGLYYSKYTHHSKQRDMVRTDNDGTPWG